MYGSESVLFAYTGNTSSVTVAFTPRQLSPSLKTTVSLYNSPFTVTLFKINVEAPRAYTNGKGANAL